MKTDSLSIKNWNIDDRPREKLMQYGKKKLSDAELIAILIGSGSRDESAVQLSRRILQYSDNQLHGLGKLSVAQLTKFKGIGEAKAITIVAALELGRRRKAEEPPKITVIQSSQDGYEVLQPLLGDLPHEEFWVLYCNTGHRVLSKKQISAGGQKGTVVDIRLLFRYALEIGATACVVAHNHPSGRLVPSRADKELTQRIQEGATYLDIRLLDHLIVAENGYYSFADEGIL